MKLFFVIFLDYYWFFIFFFQLIASKINLKKKNYVRNCNSYENVESTDKPP